MTCVSLPGSVVSLQPPKGHRLTEGGKLKHRVRRNIPDMAVSASQR